MDHERYTQIKNDMKARYPRYLSDSWLRTARIVLVLVLLIGVKVIQGGLVSSEAGPRQ